MTDGLRNEILSIVNQAMEPTVRVLESLAKASNVADKVAAPDAMAVDDTIQEGESCLLLFSCI